MDILFYSPVCDTTYWFAQLQKKLPEAKVREWQPGDKQPADYALVWAPPAEMLKNRHSLKGIFVLGAGVDALLSKLHDNPELLPPNVPLFRLKDTGMVQQMQEYAVSQTLRWFRRFDDYQQQKQQARWQPLPVCDRDSFVIGVMGAGVLGGSVAESLANWGFPVRCWSRNHKDYTGVTSYAGCAEMGAFLNGTRVLINLLPNTPETEGIINGALIEQLANEAFILNLGRGAQLVEGDLLAALDSGKVKGAALDVYRQEPLPSDNPLWQHPRIAITPHIAAVTRPEEATSYLAHAIRELERGQMPVGQVDIQLGY